MYRKENATYDGEEVNKPVFKKWLRVTYKIETKVQNILKVKKR